MKKLCLFAAYIAFYSLTTGQSPQSIPYQAVLRDTTGTPTANQHINLRFTVHNAISTGTTLYQETDTLTTSNLGLFTVNVGLGNVVTGTFSTINWADSTKYLQVEVDPTGGTSFINMGSQQMMSVPYALYAANSGSPAPSGNILLGKLLGANMNSAGVATLTLSNMSGAFVPGETFFDGGSAQIATVSGSTVTLSNINNYSFRIGDWIYPTITILTYSLISGTFQAGESVSDAEDGSLWIIDNDNGLDTMYIGFAWAVEGDTITGLTSGAVAVVNSFDEYAGEATISSFSFSGGDQAISLAGGSLFVISNTIITNPSVSLTNANDPEIWSGTSRTGSQFATAYALTPLVASNNCITLNAGGGQSGVNGNTVYFTLSKPQGSTATADIYVYGYILH